MANFPTGLGKRTKKVGVLWTEGLWVLIEAFAQQKAIICIYIYIIYKPVSTMYTTAHVMFDLLKLIWHIITIIIIDINISTKIFPDWQNL